MMKSAPVQKDQTRRLAFGAVGALLLAAGVVTAWNTTSFLSGTKPAVGTVIALGETTKAPVYPIVSFTTEDGRTIEFRHPWSSNPPAYSAGEEVEVRYDPADPTSARIGGFFSLWGMPLGLLALGVVFVFATVKSR